MNQLVTVMALLGQGDYMHMGRRFRRGGSGVDTGDFVLLFVGLLAAAGIMVLIAKWVGQRQERGFTSQRALFAELCRAHGLNWTRRRLLKRLAEEHQVAPCQLFLDPTRFSKEHCRGPLENYAAEVAALRDELF